MEVISIFFFSPQCFQKALFVMDDKVRKEQFLRISQCFLPFTKYSANLKGSIAQS